MYLRRLSILPAVLLFAAALSAQTLPQGVSKGPSMAGITEYNYPNGLKVLLLPDSGSSTITVNITYLVGSRHEGYGETGMAHLLEHMNFIKGTHDRDIKKELTDHGARWNGTTDYDRTNYFETVQRLGREPAVGARPRSRAHGEHAHGEAALDTEMTVVRNEFERGENNAGRRPRRARALHGLSLAQLRQVRDRLARRHRARADRSAARRSTASTTSRTTPCCSSPASSIASKSAARWSRSTLGAIPRPDAQAGQPTRSSRRRTANDRSNCAASAKVRT